MQAALKAAQQKVRFLNPENLPLNPDSLCRPEALPENRQIVKSKDTNLHAEATGESSELSTPERKSPRRAEAHD